MKKEYDFSKSVRGKFHNPDGDFNLPDVALNANINEKLDEFIALKRRLFLRPEGYIATSL